MRPGGAVVALAACASLCGAQGQGTTVLRGAILGTVTDSALVPLADANVEVVGAGAKVQTDARGRFVISDVPPGEFLFYVRKLGYKAVTNLVHVERGDTLRLAFTVEPTVTALEAVTVTEVSASPRMREFAERRKAGFGEFMDKGEMARLNFVHLEDYLRTFKSVKLTPKERGYGYTIVSARFSACPMQVYVDGVPLTSDADALPPPQEIAGIEAYAGPATTPMWVVQGRGKRWCGVILLWTRDR